MSEDLLDPHHLGVVTPWSAESWSRALDVARVGGVPEAALVDVVNKGAWPGFIAALPMVCKAFGEMSDAVKRCAEVMDRLPTPPAEPVVVRERALWLRQHRNTGPEPWVSSNGGCDPYHSARR